MSIGQRYNQLTSRRLQLPPEYQQYIPVDKPKDMGVDRLEKSKLDGIDTYLKTQTLHGCLDSKIYLQKFSQGSPIVLVFCQPAQELKQDYPYVPVSYCSWLESAGARCIPVPYNLTQNTMEYLVEHSNGLLVPGGNSNLYKVYQTKEGMGNVTVGFKKLWRLVVKQWARGIDYPVWGTCLGFQLVLLMISGDMKILSSLNSKNHTLNVYSYYQQSRILRGMRPQMRVSLQNKKILNFAHMNGISMDKFLFGEDCVDLRKELKFISGSKDKDDNWFCSFLQGRNHPIYISQFHPEKQAYQWNPNAVVNHNYEAVQVSQYLANQFVEQCRHNKNSFPSREEQNYNMVYNYIPQFLDSKHFQVYFIDFKFKKSKETKNPRTSKLKTGTTKTFK